MYLATQADIFGYVANTTVEPWEPEPLAHEQWPPDYRAVYAWRLRQLALLQDPVMLASAKRYYAQNRKQFALHWLDTYNPRKTADKWMPFVFFQRQDQFWDFLEEMRQTGESGLVEKCRDAGATWECCSYSVASWLFIENDSIGWGSRKQELVDRLGNPDSIFEKMRLQISRMPSLFLPRGFNWKFHATHMKLINPENGAVVMGEAGDNIGRGGRTSMYFKDESAHYARAELVEAALGDNTNSQIDISSVNGVGNVFYRRREQGIDWQPGVQAERGFTRVFVIDWRDHPEKTQEWYDLRKAKFDREGLQHVFAQEVDRNYSAAVQNTIIQGAWIDASIDAHQHIEGMDSGGWMQALDVADGGEDRNALLRRRGVVARYAREWGERDPGVATRNVVADSREYPGIVTQYDNIGLGVSVKSEYNRLVDDKLIDANTVRFVGWNAGAAVVNPYDRIIPGDDESPLNGDFFHNFKAQAWWSVRSRFYKTWRMRVVGDVRYPPHELISLASDMPFLAQLRKELAQPTSGQSSTLKTLIEKKPNGTRSPNIADALVMCYFPVDESQGRLAQGTYGYG